MAYNQYLITKFDPQYRDSHGCYTRNEWTDISDIGKEFEGKVFTALEYLETESNYVNVLNYLMKICDVTCFTVSGLEKHKSNDWNPQIYTQAQHNTFDLIDEGKKFTDETVIDAFRLCLRGDIFCRFYSQNDHFVFHADGEMYFHIICRELSKEEVNTIRNLGLKEVIQYFCEWKDKQQYCTL